MQMTRTIRNRFFAAAALATILCAMPVRAHAASKEIIQLQTQVQQLLDMVQRLQTTMDTRTPEPGATNIGPGGADERDCDRAAAEDER